MREKCFHDPKMSTISNKLNEKKTILEMLSLVVFIGTIPIIKFQLWMENSAFFSLLSTEKAMK
jgi:hypothetical protein